MKKQLYKTEHLMISKNGRNLGSISKKEDIEYSIRCKLIDSGNAGFHIEGTGDIVPYVDGFEVVPEVQNLRCAGNIIKSICVKWWIEYTNGVITI